MAAWPLTVRSRRGSGFDAARYMQLISGSFQVAPFNMAHIVVGELVLEVVDAVVQRIEGPPPETARATHAADVAHVIMHQHGCATIRPQLEVFVPHLRCKGVDYT